MSNEKKITLTIDGQQLTVPAGTTVMDAAETIGIHIPRLCYHPSLSLEGSCRVCIVKIEGMPSYVTSCSTMVTEGMVVYTNEPDVREARRDIVELILDNHPRACLTCERDSNCELQNLAYTVGVRERLFEGERKRYEIEDSGKSVIRDAEKCILCGRCVRVCHEVQGVYNLSQHNRGFNTVVTPAHGDKMDDSVCIQCGQCINACPTASLQEKRHVDRIWKALADPTKHVVVQTAPSIRAAIGEEFGYEPGTPCTGKMVTALRKLGFDKVFDSNFSADLTIIEESNELIERVKSGGKLPLITSCSPGWINFMEKFYPELMPYASTCRSPMSMLSALLKTYYAEKFAIDPKDIFVVAVMPCVAKKYEMDRPEHYIDGMQLTDAVVTTRELGWMIKSNSINFKGLEDGEFDTPLGESSGAADIFGTTGGVMEAALRTAAEKITGQSLDHVEFTDVRAVEGFRERTLQVGDLSLNIGVTNGIVNAKKLLEKVVSGEKEFHVIEIMACPGGCIGGGGQPYPPKGYKILDPELLRKRAQALYTIDQGKKLRKSHENPSIQALYDEYLGEPGGKKAHKLLHTHYNQKFPKGIK
ncbi:MAG: iron hydrogenase small subunit [Gammaproteobacteria bacterium]|nr:iron hydrogenase small subunit [Gammaproteobacteria bacterium]